MFKSTLNSIKRVTKSASDSNKRFFKFSERSTTYKKEILGGISTFIAMAYILAVNPSMLGASNGGNDYVGVFFLGTAISAFIGTILMGFVAKVPLATAPGMGVNAFFTYTVAGTVLGFQVEEALVATFISGWLYFILAITPLRSYMNKILPKNIKLAIGAMIGLFLAYIGLADSGIIVSDAYQAPWAASGVESATSTTLGSFKDPFVLIAVSVLILGFALHVLKIKGGIIIAMIAGVVMLAIAKASGVTDAEQIFKMQNYESFGKFNELSRKMWSSFGVMADPKIYIAIFVFLYTDFFDTSGTLFAVEEEVKFSKTDKKWMAKANIVDAVSTVSGSIMMTSTNTTYVESMVGVSQGSRTGFSSLVTAMLFGLSIVAWPLMSSLMPISHLQEGIPAAKGSVMPVTGPILVVVGSMMLSQLRHFNWSKVVDIPVLLVILVIGMLGYSISTGIAAGLVLYYILNVALYLKLIYLNKRNLKLEMNDLEIAESSNVSKSENTIPNLKNRILNPVMIGLFVMAVIYFATLPLYT